MDDLISPERGREGAREEEGRREGQQEWGLKELKRALRLQFKVCII